MITLLITKVLFLLFFLSLLNGGYQLAKLIKCMFSTPIKKYEIDNKNLILLWLSVAFILMTIFTGF